jgi:hypothetical protein
MTINPKLRSYTAHYIEGTAASAINGGIAAIAGIVGPAAVNALGAHVAPLTPHQLVATFAGGASMAALSYFRAHPIPVDAPDPTVTAL